MSKQDKIEELKKRMITEDSWLWPLGVPGDSMYSKRVMKAAQELGAIIQDWRMEMWCNYDGMLSFNLEPGCYRLSTANPARPSLVVREPERFETIVMEGEVPPSYYAKVVNDWNVRDHSKVVIVKHPTTHAEDEALLKRAKELLAMEDNELGRHADLPYMSMWTRCGRGIRALLTPAERGEKGGVE